MSDFTKPRHVDAGSGYLGKNRYQKSETQPPYTGKLSVDGVEYRLAAWIRRKDGDTFFSLKVSKPDMPDQARARPQTTYAQQKARTDEPPFDDDVPF